MIESQTESTQGIWNPPQCPFAVEYSPRVLDDIRLSVVDAFFSLPRGGAEVGGILLGKYDGARVIVSDYQPLECEHAFGPTFVLSARDLEKLRELLVAVRPHPLGLQPVGWYHSHTRSELFLSDADQDIHHRYFLQPWHVALVLKPHTFNPTRAGFFFREADGSIRGEASYLEFALEPLPLRPLPVAPHAQPASSSFGRAARESPGPIINVASERRPEPRRSFVGPSPPTPSAPQPIRPMAAAPPPPKPAAPPPPPMAALWTTDPAPAPPPKAAVSMPAASPPPPATAATPAWLAAAAAAPPPVAMARTVAADHVYVEPEAEVEPAPEPEIVAEVESQEDDSVPVPIVMPEPIEEPLATSAEAPEPLLMPAAAAEPESIYKPQPGLEIDRPDGLYLPLPAFAEAEEPSTSKTVWTVLFVAAGLSLGAFGYQAREAWLPRASATVRSVLPPQAPPPPSLGLNTLELSGQLQIRWDRNSSAVRSATGGAIEITDGGPTQVLQLDQAQLQSGVQTYARRSEKVDASLVVYGPEGRVREATGFLGKLPEAQAAAPAAPAASAEPAPAAPDPNPALRKERDALAKQNAKLKADVTAQTERAHKAEKAADDLRRQLRLEQRRRLGNQVPDTAK